MVRYENDTTYAQLALFSCKEGWYRSSKEDGTKVCSGDETWVGTDIRCTRTYIMLARYTLTYAVDGRM